ncbi:hypothetical protein C8F01DRAFT_751581 [Mycena amicta]|nr:hypothetical protein C8F01DRAFT_751581 [Mycena amicta]
MAASEATTKKASSRKISAAVLEEMTAQLIQKPWAEFTARDKEMWQKLSSENIRSKRPNKHTDRVAWNAHFEREIFICYHPYQQPPYKTTRESSYPETVRTTVESLSELNAHMVIFSRDLLNAEDRLILKAGHCLVSRGFEAEWAAWGQDKRAEIVLEGLYRGACQATHDNSRSWCPEMTIAGLTGDGVYGLISMLKAILAHDSGNSRARSLFFFSHPCVESEAKSAPNAPEIVKALLYQNVILRNSYIVETLLGVLDAHLGVAPRPLQRGHMGAPPKDEKHSENRRQREENLRASNKLAKEKGYRFDESQRREVMATAQYACAGCRSPQERLDLKRCSKCQFVWYCSTECQTRHWKEHKRICGLNRFDPAAVAPDASDPTPEFIGCPPAAPGFLRSPALLRQIWYLSKDDSLLAEYHWERSLERSRSFQLLRVDPRIRVIFLVARRRAMATGSRTAVAVMLNTIRLPAVTEEWSIPADEMLKQLAREYEVTPFADWAEVKRVAKEFEPVTPLEMQEEVEFIRRRHLRHEEIQRRGQVKG